MNDLDDIHRAIDDEIYARGRELTPTDGVRRAIARRRLLQRSAVAGSAAAVAAAAVVAVTVIQSDRHPAPAAFGTSASPSVVSPTGPASGTDSPPASTPPASPSTPSVATTVPSTGGALPKGLDGLLVGIQWNDTYGALVAVDATTGAVVHTYTAGIMSPSYDVLRSGTEAYFVASTDSHGCATHWSGVDLLTGNPVAAPAPLNESAVSAAVMTAQGDIVVADGGCSTPSAIRSYRTASLAAGAKASPGASDPVYVTAFSVATSSRLIAIASDGSALAYARDDREAATGEITIQLSPFFDPGFSGPKTVTLPDGCLATALAYAGQDLVAGMTCTATGRSPLLTVVRYDLNGSLLMRKDVSSKFSEAAISDVATDAGFIYYVVNAEGLEAHLYRLTEDQTDPELASQLFHIAAAP